MPVPRPSLLLIEDSPPYAKLVEALVRSAVPEDVELRHHETLAAGLADVRERSADCVLLDLGLPDAQGLEGLAALMDSGVTAPIVVLSGEDDPELAVAAVGAGAQDFLVKGEERTTLARAVRFAIARQRARERSEDLLRAREDRWRTLTHLAPVGILELGPDGVCVFANDWMSDLTRRSREELLGLGWLQGVHPDDRPAFDQARRAAWAGDGQFAVELRVVRPDGDICWAHVTAVLLRDPWAGPAGWLGTIIDVTPARRAREELAAAEGELRRQADDVLAIAALAREASVAEDPVAPLLRGGREVLGADFAALLLHDGGDRLVVDAVNGTEVPAKQAVLLGGEEPSRSAQCFEAGERIEQLDVAEDPTVSRAWAQATGARTMVWEPVRGEGETVGVLAVGWRRVIGPLSSRASTVTQLLSAEMGAAVERRRLLQQLRDLARTDPLTGLANRRLWDERLEVELARADRYARPLCVAMLDLDRFKPYNDRFGHQAGDRLLHELAASWRGLLRASDLLSRLGGDEFALLLPDCDLPCAQRIVERLQRCTEESATEVGCSAGLVRRAPGEGGDALLARADEALYAAKAAGRGRVSVG